MENADSLPTRVPGLRTLLLVAIGILSPASGVRAGDAPPPEGFGTECCEILQVPASAFRTRNFDAGWVSLQNGYICRDDVGSDLWAPVNLPTGAKIVSIGFFYFDITGSFDIVARLYRFYGGNPDTGGSGPPGEGQIVSVSSAANGFRYAQSDVSFPFTVKNDVAFDSSAGQLGITITTGADFGCALGFKSVEIRWQRQVSAPPGSATFNDVPLTDPAFQFIEALAASGVTAGCGGGNYCPDAPLTRRQMAVFLAKALGLHWPF